MRTIKKSERTKEIILAGLLNNITVRATAAATGISEDTIYRHLREPEFMAEYDRRRKALLEDSCHTLQAKMSRAVDELVKIVEDEEIKPQIRLNAVDMLLRHAYKQTELVDILTRIEALEEMSKRD